MPSVDAARRRQMLAAGNRVLSLVDSISLEVLLN